MEYMRQQEWGWDGDGKAALVPTTILLLLLLLLLPRRRIELQC